MSFLQRFFSRLGPGFERESRDWVVDCGKCGHRSNIWEMGGIRYKARGAKWSLMRCQGCGKLGMLRIHRPR